MFASRTNTLPFNCIFYFYDHYTIGFLYSEVIIIIMVALCTLVYVPMASITWTVYIKYLQRLTDARVHEWHRVHQRYVCWPFRLPDLTQDCTETMYIWCTCWNCRTAFDTHCTSLVVNDCTAVWWWRRHVQVDYIYNYYYYYYYY